MMSKLIWMETEEDIGFTNQITYLFCRLSSHFNASLELIAMKAQTAQIKECKTLIGYCLRQIKIQYTKYGVLRPGFKLVFKCQWRLTEYFIGFSLTSDSKERHWNIYCTWTSHYIQENLWMMKELPLMLDHWEKSCGNILQVNRKIRSKD